MADSARLEDETPTVTSSTIPSPRAAHHAGQACPMKRWQRLDVRGGSTAVPDYRGCSLTVGAWTRQGPIALRGVTAWWQVASDWCSCALALCLTAAPPHLTARSRSSRGARCVHFTL